MSPESAPPAGKTPLYKNPYLIGFVVGALCLTILPGLQYFVMKAPPPIASLGEWHLVDQDGQPLTNETLKGQVWIASFFFSRCPSVCPQQQADFQKILKHVDDLRSDDKKPIRLVSFSVDPEYDTPTVLKAYAEKHGEPKALWTFATGDEAALRDLLIKRMMVDVGERTTLPGNPELFDISHVAKFVLVDQNGDVRGYWSTDETSRGNLINAARLIWKRGPKV
jgi:protein SCO1/2